MDRTWSCGTELEQMSCVSSVWEEAERGCILITASAGSRKVLQPSVLFRRLTPRSPRQADELMKLLVQGWRLNLVSLGRMYSFCPHATVGNNQRQWSAWSRKLSLISPKTVKSSNDWTWTEHINNNNNNNLWNNNKFWGWMLSVCSRSPCLKSFFCFQKVSTEAKSWRVSNSWVQRPFYLFTLCYVTFHMSKWGQEVVMSPPVVWPQICQSSLLPVWSLPQCLRWHFSGTKYGERKQR